MDLLCHYHWPGNVRQLISALEHSAITCGGDTVEISDLPDYLCQARPNGQGAQQAGDERGRIAAALTQFKGNKTLAAKHLGISRVTLWKKLKNVSLE